MVSKLLEGLSDEEIKKTGSVANPVAKKIAVAAAENSGAFEFANFKPASAKDGEPGSYAFTPGQKYSLYPQLGNSKLYVLQGGSPKEIVDKDFKNYSSLKIGTKEYEKELAQVARVGWLNSTERSKEQSTIPGFWADGAGTPTVAGHYLQIAASLLPRTPRSFRRRSSSPASPSPTRDARLGFEVQRPGRQAHHRPAPRGQRRELLRVLTELGAFSEDAGAPGVPERAHAHERLVCRGHRKLVRARRHPVLDEHGREGVRAAQLHVAARVGGGGRGLQALR